MANQTPPKIDAVTQQDTLTNRNTPAVQIIEDKLQKAGFTGSGTKKYKETVTEYAETLFQKSVSYAEASNNPGLPLEVTHQAVNQAAISIAGAPKAKRHSKLVITGQVLEYVFTALVGIGGGNLKETWGIVAFGVGTALVAILIVTRLIVSKSEQ